MHRHHLRSVPGVLAPAILAWLPMLPAAADAPPMDAWSRLRLQYYSGRSIDIAEQAALIVEAPAATPDPAATALTIRFGDNAVGHIRQLRVFIDNNPAPVAATFDFAPGSRIAEIGMRVRVDRMTQVRAVAETTDGALEMRSTGVNAAGGCSAAPAGGGNGALGDIRFRNTADGRSLQVAVRHPNNSGFQVDPVSGETLPAHYVTHLRISSAGHPMLDVETGISLSENPSIRLSSDAALPAPLAVEVTDSRDAHFSATWPGAGAEKLSDAAVGAR